MKDEKKRIKELMSYEVLNTSPEQELNEIAEIAALMFNTPISFISFVDEERQWFKAQWGFAIEEHHHKDIFCDYTLKTPETILVVEDTLLDERFNKSDWVQDNTNIRFYAGAPLITPNNHVLGTLCVIDHEPRRISENQKKALQLLAKKAMNYLNTKRTLIQQREEVAASAAEILKLTENIPSTIFQLRKEKDGHLSYDFVSLGNFQLPGKFSFKEIKQNAKLGLEFLHKEDIECFKKSFTISCKQVTTWKAEFRIHIDKDVRWFMVKADPEKLPNGDIVWYGIFHEITSHIAYEEAMEKMAFDISHILRKPVANLIGLAQLLNQEQNLNEDELKKYVEYIQTVSEELTKFTIDLNKTYQHKYKMMCKTQPNRD